VTGPKEHCHYEAPVDDLTQLADADSSGSVPALKGPLIEGRLALQGGHSVSILVDRVGKPTDNEIWAVIRNHD
jgi:hypothetical protein